VCDAGRAGHGARGTLADDEDNPVDLLNPSTARALVRTAAGADDDEARDDFEFERNALGQLVIKEPEEEEDLFGWTHRKRPRRGTAAVSEDGDLEDMADVIGVKAAYKKTENAASLRHASAVAHSHKTAASRRSKATATSAAASTRGKAANSAARFKAKRGAGGDSRGGGAVEPFAYWRFDKGLLNSRQQKRRGAQAGVKGVVGAAGKSDTAKHRGLRKRQRS
jgi:hypothetical protein